MQRKRYERSLMSPIFEQPPLLRSSPGGRVDQRTVIGSKSGEGWQVMGADQDIDAVDLVQGEPIDGLQPSRGGDPFRARAAESLGSKSDPPRLWERKFLHFRQLAPSGGSRWRSTPIPWRRRQSCRQALAAFCPNSGPVF